MREPLNVNVGDKLILHERTERIVTVTRITPTGRIRIDKSDSQFDKYGWEMIGYNRWRTRNYLSVPTEDNIERIKKRGTIIRALNLMRATTQSNNLTYEQALKIIEILDVKEKDDEECE
jgi:hypothetical protein